MKTPTTIFVCTACDYQSKKWLGKCPECGSWNTLEEETYRQPIAKTSAKGAQGLAVSLAKAEKLSAMQLPSYMRKETGMTELDRVLGGGLVSGSVVLLSGEPGIGKSTLLMQISHHLSEKNRVLYVSGEESGGQLKLRAERLSVATNDFYILTETDLDGILAEADRVKPDVMIVDSVQTIQSQRSSSVAGSITQVRDAAQAMIQYAKGGACAVFLVGHVNKEGSISGPKTLEHMVDAVLYFEGERRQSYRIIRAMKNRYGSTNEIGVFEMGDKGLRQITNPSQMLMEGRPKGISGSCAACIMEGTRPLITEIQALVSPTVFPSPRRTADGFDYNRMCLLLAVLERRVRLHFSTQDVYLNIAGGLRLDEPAADLAVSIALISAITDRVVPEHLIAFGEIGLAGEVRAISHIENRVKEAARLGFTTIILPYREAEKAKTLASGVSIVGAKSLFEILPYLIKRDEAGK